MTTTTAPLTALTTDDADELVRRALGHAGTAGFKVGVVVLDAGGNLLAARRHHEAYLTTITIATKKAFTALNFRVPTHEMAERLGTVEYAIQVAQVDERLAFVKGGRPVVRDGIVVGAIGVSGGSAADDLACADAALD